MSISCDHSLQPISNSTKLSRSLTVPPFVVIRNIYLICVILCDLLLRNINQTCLLLLKFKLPFHQKYLFQSCHLIATFFPRIYQLLRSSTETAFSSKQFVSVLSILRSSFSSKTFNLVDSLYSNNLLRISQLSRAPTVSAFTSNHFSSAFTLLSRKLEINT